MLPEQPTSVIPAATSARWPDPDAQARSALHASVTIYRGLRDQIASPALFRREAAERAARAYLEGRDGA